jgi:hypothetical protein
MNLSNSAFLTVISDILLRVCANVKLLSAKYATDSIIFLNSDDKIRLLSRAGSSIEQLKM